jgi:GNAT superfamily N-acetyltransferase
MPWTLRTAAYEDLERLLPLVEVFWAFEQLPFHTSDVRGALSGLLANQEYGRVFLAERAGTLLGYLVLTFGYSLEHGGRDGLIDELYVCAEERSLGIGTALIEAACACCRSLCIWRLHLEVDRTNPRAERLYVGLGFRANDRHLLTRKLR